MKAPDNLSHKPIISWNDYDEEDGIHCHSDAKALSIGMATYDSNEISLKVWRKPGKRWSRQSEELPIHRNLDLTILLLSVLNNGLTSKMSEDMPLGVSIVETYCSRTRNAKEIGKRLKQLYSLLTDLDDKGIIETLTNNSTL